MPDTIEREEHDLNGAEVAALRSRWNEKVPDGEETALVSMVRRLKTESKQQNARRPEKLDLRGITLFHEDLSGLDLSGCDLSFANLNRSNLAGTILSDAKLHRVSLEHVILDGCEFLGADLSHASLNECSAIKCGFGGADLSHASIISADLSEATLSCVNKGSLCFHSLKTNATLKPNLKRC